MTPETYRNRLASLGLHAHDRNTQYWLGLSRRQLIRIHQGHSPVPGPLERLLNLYARFGLVE